MSKKSFGEHIEDGLSLLGDGFSSFGERIYKIHRESREHNDESISLGLISDTDKLRMLKADLYRKARAEGNVKDLVSAITTIEASLYQQFQRDNTLEAVASRFITSLFLVGITAVTLSFPITYACGHSQSHFCRNSGVLTDWVTSEFQKPQPVKVLPLDLDK